MLFDDPVPTPLNSHTDCVNLEHAINDFRKYYIYICIISQELIVLYIKNFHLNKEEV